MKKKYADYLIKLAFLTLALFIVFDFSVVSGFFGKLFTVSKPVFFGVLFFMILSVPYDNREAAERTNPYPELPKKEAFQREVLTGIYSR